MASKQPRRSQRCKSTTPICRCRLTLSASQIYFFKNIRYAAPPVGNLRFSKPAPPTPNDTLQTGAYGKSCVQSNAKPFSSDEASPKSSDSFDFAGSLSSLLGWLSGTFDLGKLQGGAESGEDCLFLDLYVPGKALKGNVKLPIINWIYGGESSSTHDLKDAHN
jgi:carboxylesterase type B